jgi:S-disulfanyl-L-cysteine oxidoreductase SoxD
MSWHRIVGAGVFFVLWLSPVLAVDFGRRATPEEIRLWDIDVRPDGTGLPEGSGSAEHGKSIFEENCSGCHGEESVG